MLHMTHAVKTLCRQNYWAKGFRFRNGSFSPSPTHIEVQYWLLQ